MPEKMQGMGAIQGVGIGYIMKAGQALDGYLAAYQPGTVEEELEKLNNAVAEVADILEKSVEQMRAVGHDEQANIMEAHLFLAQDPMLTDGMTDKVQEMGNAPAAILASAAESAKIFQSMDDEYLRERAADVLGNGCHSRNRNRLYYEGWSGIGWLFGCVSARYSLLLLLLFQMIRLLVLLWDRAAPPVTQ